MKTKTINLYSYKELSETAKRVARKTFEYDCLEYYANADWDDARRTIKRVGQMCECTFQFQSSSHGYTCNVDDALYDDSYDDANDEMRFDLLKLHISEMFLETHTDLEMQRIAQNYTYKKGKWYNDFRSNLSSMMSEFADTIETNTSDYLEQSVVEDYIKELDVDFLESGKVFKE